MQNIDKRIIYNSIHEHYILGKQNEQNSIYYSIEILNTKYFEIKLPKYLEYLYNKS